MLFRSDLPAKITPATECEESQLIPCGGFSGQSAVDYDVGYTVPAKAVCAVQAAGGYDYSPCLERISAAVGIFHLHARYGTSGREKAQGLVFPER